MTDDDTGSPKTIQSVHNAVDILEFLRDTGEATVTEIAENVDVSLSTAYSHLMTLLERQYVEKDGDKYRIGIRFLTFGGQAREQDPVYQIGRETLDELAEKTGETARLVVERDGYGITLCQSLGDLVDETQTFPGMQETLHSTAAGKAFLANFSQDRVEEILDKRGLPQQTEHTITDREELFAELEEVETQGIAFDFRENFDDWNCVAGPIIREGELLGAVSLTAPVDRRDESWLRNEAAPEIRNATGVIKVNSTYSSWSSLQEE